MLSMSNGASARAHFLFRDIPSTRDHKLICANRALKFGALKASSRSSRKCFTNWYVLIGIWNSSSCISLWREVHIYSPECDNHHSHEITMIRNSHHAWWISSASHLQLKSCTYAQLYFRPLKPHISSQPESVSKSHLLHYKFDTLGSPPCSLNAKHPQMNTKQTHLGGNHCLPKITQLQGLLRWLPPDVEVEDTSVWSNHVSYRMKNIKSRLYILSLWTVISLCTWRFLRCVIVISFLFLCGSWTCDAIGRWLWNQSWSGPS
jgi:hypothetical protein